MPLAVRNWTRFQHYTGRRPPWIKVYTDLLTDAAYLALAEGARAQLVLLWLLAAKNDNTIPDDPAFLRNALHAKTLHVEALISAGFIERNASRMLATPADDTSKTLEAPLRLARADARSREVEIEVERETTPPTGGSIRDAFLAGMPELMRVGWRGTFASWEDGMGAPGGRPIRPAQIDAGIAEYLAHEREPDYAPKHVVRYVEGVAGRRANGSRPGANGATGYLASVVAEADTTTKGNDAVP